MANIHIGAIGSGTGYGIITSLQEQLDSNVKIFGADIFDKHLVASSAVVDEFIKLPLATDDNFTEQLLEALNKNNIDVYAPVVDAEIAVAAKLNEQGLLPCKTTASSVQTLDICNDKLKTFEVLSKHNIPTPLTWDLQQYKWQGDAVLLKPKSGFGSKGVFVADNESMLNKAQTELQNYVVQQLCTQPEITSEGFISYNNDFAISTQRERLEVKSGVCVKARVFYDKEIEGITIKLGKALNIKGSYCIQLMRGQNNNWLVTDVNPRPGAGSRLSAAVGLNYPAAGVMDLLGHDPSKLFVKPSKDRYVARQYREFVLN